MMGPHISAITTMKLSTRGALAGLLALTMSATACDRDLTGLNENPNAPTDVDPEFLFPQGVTAVVGLVRGAGFDLHLTSLWAQHYAKIQYVDEDWYQIRPQSIERAPTGERLTRFYEYAGSRFIVVFEPFERNGEARIAAIYLP